MGYSAHMSPKSYIMPPLPIRRAEDIAGLIKSRREALGLSQQALADRLTVSRKWVNEIERGNSNAKLGLVLRALNELEISVSAQSGPSSGLSAGAGGDDSSSDAIDIDAIVDAPPGNRSR